VFPRDLEGPPRPSLSPSGGAVRVSLAPERYRGIIEKAAEKHGVNAALVEAVIRVESAFRPRAVSRKGARGLMQLMPDTAKRFGVRDMFDPEQNVHGGTRYLAWLLRLFEGDVELACAAYNAGERAVQRFGGVPPYRETRDYVRKIAGLLRTHGGSGAVPAAEPPKKRETIYVWHDARGILNISQFPPPFGQRYKTLKPR
jgi:hypothetical protein